MPKWKIRKLIWPIFAIPMVSLPIFLTKQTNFDCQSTFKSNNINNTEGFIEKINLNQITKLNQNEYVGYSLRDMENLKSHQITIQNQNLMYEPFYLTSLKQQTLNASNSINELIVNDFIQESKNLTKKVNSFVQILSLRPFLERSDLTLSNGNNYQWKKVDKVLMKYSSSSIYGYGETNWINLTDDCWFQNQIGKSYESFWLFENNSWLKPEQAIEIVFPAAYKDSKMFVTSEIEYLDNNEILFKVGSAGSDPNIKSNFYTWENYIYRAGFEVKAKYIPTLSINSIDLTINNPEYNLSTSNLIDTRYSFVSLEKKNDFNETYDCSNFLNYRKNIVNQLTNLRNDNEHYSYLNQYLSNDANLIDNQIKLKKSTVNENYNIVQYEYQIPNELHHTHTSYKVINNTLLYLRQYEGISNLIADQIILDPNSGVKEKYKFNTDVYDASNYEEIGLSFKFNDEFLNLLNIVDEYNKLLFELINVTKEELNWIKLIKPIWNFNYDIEEYNGNIGELIQKLKNENLEETNTNNKVIQKFKYLLKDNSSLVNDSILFFFHNLPQLFNDFYNQMTIQATISQSGQLPKKATIFNNKEFQKINFDNNILKNNHAYTSVNKAVLLISNISIENKIFTSENLLTINLTNVCQLYPECETITFKDMFIEYELYYRGDYANIKPLNGKNTSFKIDKSIDKEGLLATDYLDNKNKYKYICTTINKNLISQKNVLNFDESTLIVLNKESDLNENLKKVVATYDIDWKPNNKTGIFYAQITIKNSNDLNFYGDSLNSEIIPNQMWFVQQESNPIYRTYLFKFEAAKKNLSTSELIFSVTENKNLKLTITSDNEIEEFILKLNKDEHNNLFLSQTIDLSFLTYWDFYDNELNLNSFFTLENAFAKLGYALFNQNVLFNQYTKEITLFLVNENIDLEIIDLDEQTIQLVYKNNNIVECKYELKYELILNETNLKINLISNKFILENSLNFYIKSFAKLIEKAFIEKINKNDLIVKNNLKIESLSIDFDNGEINVKLKNENELDDKTTNENNNLGLILGIAIPIITIAIISSIFIIRSKSKKTIS